MSITRDFKLSLVAGRSVPLVINANQYDHGEIWRFTLLDENGQKYSPSTGSIIGLKSDGHIIANAGTVSSTGLVIIPETEQMTASPGKNFYELLIDDDTHGTANFIVFVEPRPGAGGTPSDSDLAVFQEAIDAAETVVSLSETFGSPLVAQTAAEMTLTNRVYVYTGSESGYTYGNWYYYDGTAWRSGGVYQSAAVVVDSALSTTSQNPVQNKVITEEITDLKNALTKVLQNSYAEYTVPVWNQGRIAPSTGSAVTDTTAIYSTSSSGGADLQALAKDYVFYLDCPSGYTVQVFEYSGTSWTSYVERAMTETALPCVFAPNADKYYRFVLKLSSGSTFAPADVPAFKVYKIEKESVIDNAVTTLTSNVSSLNSDMSIVKESTDNINTAGQGRYYIKSNGTIGASSENYIGMSSYVPCEASTKYSVNLFDSGTTTTCGYYVAFYDSQGALVGSRLNVNTGAGYAVFESPATAVYIAADVYSANGVSANAKISIIKGESKAGSYVPPVTAKDMIARNLVDTANRMITACNTALNKKIITWIDDDTGLSAIPTVKSMCDTLGIKCTFACITSRLNDASLVNLLKSYQESGFHVTCHSHTHGTWYGDNPYNAEQIENDLIISLEALRDNGFLDSDMLVYPGSSPSRTDIDVISIVRKWCKCGVKASGTNFTGFGDGEYLINRVFFDVSEHDAQYYTDILDAYTLDQAPWVIFGSHSANPSEFDSAMITTVLTHALANGWTFMTLNEAIKYRQKYFDIKEMYGL